MRKVKTEEERMDDLIANVSNKIKANIADEKKDYDDTQHSGKKQPRKLAYKPSKKTKWDAHSYHDINIAIGFKYFKWTSNKCIDFMNVNIHMYYIIHYKYVLFNHTHIFRL